MGQFVGTNYSSPGFKSSETDRIDQTGAKVFQAAHAPYYEAVKRGRVFIGSNAVTGLAIPIYSAKANALSLWNPTGSGVDVVLLKTIIGYYSTANVIGSIVYGITTGAGATIATAAPILTFTEATPINAYVSSGQASCVKFSPAVNTTTANPTFLQSTGLSCGAYATATTSAPPWTMVDYVDGAIILPPGVCIQLVGTTAVALVANQTFVWEEVPI